MAATEFTIENEVAPTESESTRNKAETEDWATGATKEGTRKVITFFSHSNDKRWVEETTDKLRDQFDQFVCQHGDADFIGGVSIPDNILRLIRECDTIVLVLSPDFLNSELCKYEAQLTMNEHLFREQKVVIPVLLRGKDTPDFISHLIHLDHEDTEFWKKFMGALAQGDPDKEDRSISLQSFNMRREQDQFNGKLVLKVESRGHCCGEGYDCDSIFHKLYTKGIQIDNENREKVKEAMENFGCNSYICCMECYTLQRTRKILLSLLYFALFSILCLLAIAVLFAVWMFPAIGVILFLLFSIILMGIYKLLTVYVTTAMRAVNSVLIDHDILFGLGKTNFFTGRRELAFFYFRTKCCQAYIERHLREHWKNEQRRKTIRRCFYSNIEEESYEMRSMTSENTTIEKLAKRYLSEVAGIYVYQHFRKRLTNPSTGQRHSPQDPCLCQMVEEMFFRKHHVDKSPNISLFENLVYRDIFRDRF